MLKYFTEYFEKNVIFFNFEKIKINNDDDK